MTCRRPQPGAVHVVQDVLALQIRQLLHAALLAQEAPHPAVLAPEAAQVEIQAGGRQLRCWSLLVALQLAHQPGGQPLRVSGHIEGLDAALLPQPALQAQEAPELVQPVRQVLVQSALRPFALT